MGKLSYEVTFATPLPELSAIVAKIEELSGLPVSVLPPTKDESPRHAFYARLAFSCAPEQEIALYGAESDASPASGRETIQLEGWALREPTLPMVAVLALEALGGRPHPPLSDQERQQYSRPITPQELIARRRRAGRQAVRGIQLSLLLLPFLLPFYAAQGLWRALFSKKRS